MGFDFGTVSVVVPSHDRAALLPRALDSIIAQSRPVAEIVVVNDGSTDHTEAVLAGYSAQLRIVRQPCRGVAAARNAGIREARGEWIAFLDSDDEWLPHKIELQMQALAQSGDWIGHSDEIWVRRGVRVNQMNKHRKRGGRIFRDCLPLCVISPSAVVINRRLFDRLGMFDESLPACEDYDLWLRVCSRFAVTYVAQPLLRKFGGHDDQLSSRYQAMDRFRIQALEKILRAGLLGGADRAAVLDTLVKRMEIFGRGAAKRERQTESAHYLNRAAHHRVELTRLRRDPMTLGLARDT